MRYDMKGIFERRGGMKSLRIRLRNWLDSAGAYLLTGLIILAAILFIALAVGVVLSVAAVVVIAAGAIAIILGLAALILAIAGSPGYLLNRLKRRRSGRA